MRNNMTKEEFDKLDLCDTCEHRTRSKIGIHYLCKLPNQLRLPVDKSKVCLIESKSREHMTVKRCNEYKEIK